MTDAENRLTSAIRILIQELEGTDNPTANFFHNVLGEIQSTNDQSEKAQIAETRLVHAGALSQYANFTRKQDEAFEMVYDAANALTGSIP